MKKLLSILLSMFLLFGLMSCDLGNEDDKDDSSANASEYKFQVDWSAYLSWGTFNAALKDVDGTTVIEAQGGSEPASVEGNDASTETYFGTAGSSYHFVHDGSDSYGGVMTSFDGGYDISECTEVKIAIKGDLSDLDALELQLGDAAGDQKLNILAYDSIADGDWNVYVIELKNFDKVSFATFDWAAIWNPKATGYTMEDETGYGAADFIYDIAFN